MYNFSSSYNSTPQFFSESHLSPLDAVIPTITNKYVYVRKNAYQNGVEAQPLTVLVNPNFNKKVFVNPNFHGNIRNNMAQSTERPKIHINPKVTNFNLEEDIKCKNVSKIHVNPNILKNMSIPKNDKIKSNENICKSEIINSLKISTSNKLILPKLKIANNNLRKRRLSIRSQYKIIKSSVLEKSICNRKEIRSKYKFVKPNNILNDSKNYKLGINKFTVNNRNNSTLETSPKNKKYVYINRFLSISDIAKTSVLRQNKWIHNKSVYATLILNPYKKTNNIGKRTEASAISKSKYKLIRKSPHKLPHKSIIKQEILKDKELRKMSLRKKNLKMKLCNIPCPYYRKFGKCKGKENGKCSRKHDPDQIALCTKFLQGACVNKNCLLSHNVSPEKMPTCKFYLEGSCSRDDCPYLHVRISPNADICKEFLGGFCIKAARCDKRHQFLCPDYEKSGNCHKQRCPYPHGKMVRKYSVFNKNKFAKKSSDYNLDEKNAVVQKSTYSQAENMKSVNCEGSIKSRYYNGQNKLVNEEKIEILRGNYNTNNDVSDSKFRPKLGKLPSFIAFENI